jgi:D-threonate/D-erythronate kinase
VVILGAEISGLMDSLDIRHAILVPALPSNERTTINGNVYVKGVLLAETEIADDPKTPVRESYIPKIISYQTDKKIALINYKEILSGKQNLIQKVEQHMKNGIHMIVIDAQEKGGIDLIASAITTIKEKVLFAGSSGLAEFLPKYFDIKKEKKSNIVIAGSVSEVTRKQIDYAKEKLAITLIEVEIEELFTKNKKKEKNRIIDIIKESSLKGEDVIIRSASTKAIVTKSFEIVQKYGLTRFKVSETIAMFLGEIARYIIQEIKINGVLFTGGDTLIKAVKCLNISGTILKY